MEPSQSKWGGTGVQQTETTLFLYNESSTKHHQKTNTTTETCRIDTDIYIYIHTFICIPPHSLLGTGFPCMWRAKWGQYALSNGFIWCGNPTSHWVLPAKSLHVPVQCGTLDSFESAFSTQIASTPTKLDKVRHTLVSSKLQMTGPRMPGQQPGNALANNWSWNGIQSRIRQHLEAGWGWPDPGKHMLAHLESYMTFQKMKKGKAWHPQAFCHVGCSIPPQ